MIRLLLIIYLFILGSHSTFQIEKGQGVSA